MRIRNSIVCAVALSLTMGFAVAQPGPSGIAKFVDAKGEASGEATLTQTPQGVLIRVDVRNLQPGEHAIHIHEAGRCEADGGFKSAGGHYAPRKHEHGFLVEKGAHGGDMPNQFAGDDGRLRAEILNANVTLGSGEGTLFDSDGSAIVIHAKADDYKSQPAGDAGDRVACAVIEKK